MRRAILASLLLAGCAPHASGSAAATDAPVALSPTHEIAVPQDRADRATALVDDLRLALAKKDRVRAGQLISGGDLLESANHQILDILSSRDVKFRLEPVCPAGPGIYVRFVLMHGLFPDPGPPIAMYAGPGPSGDWVLFPAGPRDTLPATLSAETTRVSIDPESGTLRGTATLTVAPGGVRWLPIDLDLMARDDDGKPLEKGGYDLDGLEQDGAPVPFHVLGEAAVVVAEIDATKPSTTLRLAFHGAPGKPIDFLTPDEMVLHEAQAWLPVLERTDADFDLTVDYPPGFQVLMQGDPPPRKEAGRLSQRIHVHSTAPPTVFGRRRYTIEHVDLGDAKVTIAVGDDKAAQAPQIAKDIVKTHEGLKALGPLPAKDLRIVESTPPPEIAAVGGRSFIALGPEGLDRLVIAHELAHSWFGGLVPSTGKGDWGGQWPEPMAEYSVTWTVDEPTAARKRAEWSDCYAGSFGDEEPLRSARNMGVERALLYCKGPLLLAALEHRIGRPAMQQALASFVTARANQPSSWEDVVASVRGAAGADAGDWLRDRLALRGAPAYYILSPKLDGGTISFDLGRDDVDHPLPEEIELVVQDSAGKELSRTVLKSAGPHTPITVTAGDGAASIVLDPDHHAVWKHGASKDSTRWVLPHPARE